MRTGTRVSPSWPGARPEAGYVDADPSEGALDKTACRRGGPYVLDDPTERPFDDPSLREHDETFEALVCSLDDGDSDPARLEGGPLRFIAVIAAIGEARCHERASCDARRAAKGGGGSDLAFDRQSERVDRDLTLAAFDLLGGLEAPRAASDPAVQWNGRPRRRALPSFPRADDSSSDTPHTSGRPTGSPRVQNGCP